MGSLAYLEPNELTALNDLKQAINHDFQLVDFRLYGSKARGTADADSDIDVMIELEELTPNFNDKVFDVVFDVNLRYGVFISAVLFGRKELEDGPCLHRHYSRQLSGMGYAYDRFGQKE